MKVYDLVEIARLAMATRGLEPEFSKGVLIELAGISRAALDNGESLRDLTHLLWCSIDNDDSMDLDQITVAEMGINGIVKIFVGVSDVDAVVKIGHPIDLHARKNTTSVYTGVINFPMLPEKLSTDLTSLSEGETRVAFVVEMTIYPSGEILNSDIYRANVQNQAKLTYDSVAAWLEGTGPMPEKMRRADGMEDQLRTQDLIAQRMRALRYKHGALELETIEPRAIIKKGTVVEMQTDKKNRARELIEDFMIAANGVTARYLTQAGYPTLRRVVRSPARWDRIVQVAVDLGEHLPAQPDSKALAEFLSRRKSIDPQRFPDLSLIIVKVMGRGEYVLELPGEVPLGHFGLAVLDYAHSTAPNRRFPDLITHRLLKAAKKKQPSPYTIEELKSLASHCTQQQDAADKVERQVRKSASALLMLSKIGEYFDGLVTGASEKGTWARVILPPVEGKIVHGQFGLDVGDKVRLKLIAVNVERGFIDFATVGP